jgi:hypothetical protein
MPYHIFLQQHYYCTTWVRYIIIETREFSRIGYNGFLFPHSYSGDGLGATYAPRPSPEYECVHQGRHPRTNACTKTVTWVRMRKNKPVLSNTGRFFCFNSTVIYTCTESNIDVVLKASRAVVIMWFSLNEAPLGLFKFISD